jgi:hypothetical protein
MKTKTDLDRLNALIDFYENHKADGGPSVIPVKFRDEALSKFATRVAGKPNHWYYRQRELKVIK